MTKLKRKYDWKPLRRPSSRATRPGGVLRLETPYRAEYEIGPGVDEDDRLIEVSEGEFLWRAVPSYRPNGLEGYTLWKGRANSDWGLITSVREVPKILHGPNSLEELNEFIDLFLDGVELGEI